MIKLIAFSLYNSIRTGLKLSAVFVIIGFPVMLFTRLVFGVSADESTAFVVVPLTLTYVAWRLLRIVCVPLDVIKIKVAGTVPQVVMIGIVSFGVPMMFIEICSMIAYTLLGALWAANAARILTIALGAATLVSCFSLMVSVCDLDRLSSLYRAITPILIAHALGVPRRIKNAIVPKRVFVARQG